MAFNLYVSNKIGSEALGTFSLIMSVYMFFIILATSGLSIACTCIVSEQFAKNNYLDGFKAVKSCLFFGLLLGLGSSILVLLFSNIISLYWLKAMISSTPVYLISIGLPFISISSVLNGYFSAVRKGYKSAFCQVFELFVKIIATILLFNIFTNKGIESICICLILSDIISEISSCCLLIFFYQKEKFRFIDKSINAITFKKEIFKISFPVAITSYIRSGLSTLKQFIIPSRLVLFGLTLLYSEIGLLNMIDISNIYNIYAS